MVVGTSPDCDATLFAVNSTAVYWSTSSGPLYELSIQGGAPAVLANATPPLGVSLAADDSRVFWFDDGQMAMAPAGGGSTSALDYDAENWGSLALDDNNVYWASTDGDLSGRILKVPKAGNGHDWIAAGDVLHGLRKDNAYVYWATDTAIMRASQPRGAPIVVAQDPDGPTELAIDATAVYWATFSDSGTIKTAPIGGGAPTTIAAGQRFPRQVAVWGAYVYWVNDNSHWNGTSDTLVRAPIAGGAPAVLGTARSQIHDIAVDGTSVFWSDMGGVAGELVRQTLLGGGATTNVSSGPGSFAVDSTHVYWFSLNDSSLTTLSTSSGVGPVAAPFGAHLALYGGDRYYPSRIDRISRAPLAGGPETLVARGVSCEDMVVDSSGVYCRGFYEPSSDLASLVGDGIVRVPLSGDSVTAVASANSSGPGLTVDSSNIYWFGNGTIEKVRLDGSAPTRFQLPSLAYEPEGMVSDGTYLYVSSRDGLLKLSVQDETSTQLTSDPLLVPAQLGGNGIFWAEQRSCDQGYSIVSLKPR